MPSEFHALPPGVRISAGHCYPDRWITPRLTLELTPPATGSRLLITLWNPDFAPQLSNNAIEVRFQGETRRVNSISLNQTLEIVLGTASAEPVPIPVSLDVSRYLDACEYDDRKRALKIGRLQWIDDKGV